MAELSLKPDARLEGSRLFNVRYRGRECVVTDCLEVPDGGRFYCATHAAVRDGEHKATRQARQEKAPRRKAEKVQTITEGAPPPPSNKGTSSDEKKAADWLGMVLVMLTYVVGLKAAGGRGIFMSGADKELATRLAMTDAQADNIARVVAKKVVPTRLYKRVGRQAVETLDLELVAALEAAWEWGSTIAPYLRRRPVVVDVSAYQSQRSSNGTVHSTTSPLGQGGFVPAHRLDN